MLMLGVGAHGGYPWGPGFPDEEPPEEWEDPDWEDPLDWEDALEDWEEFGVPAEAEGECPKCAYVVMAMC
jgi:hypothetical protein